MKGLIKLIIIYLMMMVGVPALAATWYIIQNNRLDTGFGRIKRGIVATQVFDLMGSPSWNVPCSENQHNIYGDAKKKPECSRELGFYGSFRDFPDGHYYLVWLNKDNRVLDAAKISSP